MQITLDVLTNLLPRFADLSVAVIGDLALDGYWMLSPEAAQPSIETGKPTLPVTKQHYAPGAAANVAINLLTLGCGHVSVFGVVGPDPWGAELRRQLTDRGANCTGVLLQATDWNTATYLKPHSDGEEQRRFDFGDFNRLQEPTADRMLDALRERMSSLNAVIVNAQATAGIHTPYVRGRLTNLIGAHPETLFLVDSRDPIAQYPGCSLKINDREAMAHDRGRPPDAESSRDPTLTAARNLFALRGKPVFVTRGSRGMVVCDADGLTEVPAVPVNGPVDTTGAGDAALAGIAAALAAGADTRQAALVGTLTASICASKLHQTGSATPDELLARLREGRR